MGEKKQRGFFALAIWCIQGVCIYVCVDLWSLWKATVIVVFVVGCCHFQLVLL
jgi:hypothetical protein